MDHQRDPKARVNRKVSTRHFDKHQKQQILILSGILAAVVLFLVFSYVIS